MPSSLQLQTFNPANPAITNGVHSLKSLQNPAAPRVVFPLSPENLSFPIPDSATYHHAHVVGPDQCCSAVVQTIEAPVSTVWSIVRRFDNPQAYKHFIKTCHVIDFQGEASAIHVGALREVHVVSGLPAESSTERLEILDDQNHIISFSVVGGDHRLRNYRSVTTLHQNGSGTIVVESYVVDVPQDNTKDETCIFADTIVRCNLQSLAQLAGNMVRTGGYGNQN